jgi:hypothetical protein
MLGLKDENCGRMVPGLRRLAPGITVMFVTSAVPDPFIRGAFIHRDYFATLSQFAPGNVVPRQHGPQKKKTAGFAAYAAFLMAAIARFGPSIEGAVFDAADHGVGGTFVRTTS